MANEIQAAIRLLEAERNRIDTALRALKGVEGKDKTANSGKTSEGGKRKRPRLSAAARKRIADAQRKRWAAQKAKEKKGA